MANKRKRQSRTNAGTASGLERNPVDRSETRTESVAISTDKSKPTEAPTAELNGAIWKKVLSGALLFAALFGCRYYFNAHTLDDSFVENTFRIGFIPWSDANGWVSACTQIINGNAITGSGGYRPLYSLFLVSLFSILGDSYEYVIIAQLLIFALVVVFAYQILSPVKPRSAVLIFIAFLSIWRPEVSTIFMTENLGMYLLILSFALTWRGIYLSSAPTMWSGYFLLGLSQAVRPWCVVSLATVPFIAFFLHDSFKHKIRSFVLFTLFVSLGFSFHSIASKIFCDSVESSSFAHNYAFTLYGQVSGGIGWTSTYRDPEIAEIRQRDHTTKELTDAMFRRSKEKFFEDPKKLVLAIKSAYLSYLRTVPDAYRVDSKLPVFSIAILAMLSAINVSVRVKTLFRSKLHPARWWLPVAGIATALLYYSLAYTATLMCILGLVYVITRMREKINVFVLLYGTGILLSIPLVGYDGGERVKISNDIFLYLIAALGMAWVFNRFQSPASSTECRQSGVITKFAPWGIPACAAILLIIVPLSVKALNSNNSQSIATRDLVGATDVAKQLSLSEIPVDSKELGRLWNIFPKPSYELLNDRFAFYPIEYMTRDTMQFEANDGVTSAWRRWQLWPLLPSNVPRTVHISNSRFTMFPNTTREKLRRFDYKNIIVVGRLMTGERSRIYSTGYVLVVRYVGVPGEDSKIEWVELEQL